MVSCRKCFMYCAKKKHSIYAPTKLSLDLNFWKRNNSEVIAFLIFVIDIVVKIGSIIFSLENWNFHSWEKSATFCEISNSLRMKSTRTFEKQLCKHFSEHFFNFILWSFYKLDFRFWHRSHNLSRFFEQWTQKRKWL